MKNFKIVLKSRGMITQLPDSQKIFGALITMLAKFYGDKKTSQIVKEIFNKKVHFAVSNLLPNDYFPMPQDYVVDKLAQNVLEQENLKEKRAAVKEKSYVKYENLIEILEDPERKEDYSYIKTSDSQQLRASIESSLYGFEGLETKLYTVPILKLKEIDNKSEKSVSEFCFYLQGEEGEMLDVIQDVIHRLIQTRVSLVLGKRASQGLNKYQVVEVKEIDLPKSDIYLNLGMLLPNKIDFSNSILKLFTSERRPFEMLGGWNEDCKKYFISFIDASSIIVLTDGVKNAGKCVQSPFNKERDIVFGNAFLYPIRL